MGLDYGHLILYVIAGWCFSNLIYNENGKKDLNTFLLSLFWVISIPTVFLLARWENGDDDDDFDDSKNSGV